MLCDLKGGHRRWFDRLINAGTVAGLSDGELLRRFTSQSDEAAFETLAARHGPMVLGVCRRILDDGHAAEDAFQATFLILVRRSRSLRDDDRLGSWLHGVARRVSLRARQRNARRRDVERPGVEAITIPAPEADGGQRERLAWLDEEVARMPERFRSPLILCYLEGLTHEEAARQLGCPLGTIRSRIARARDMLRARIARRGVAAPASLLAAGEVSPFALATPVPAVLFDAMSRTAIRVASGREVLAAGGSSAVALATEVHRTMMISRWKSTALALSMLGASIGGAALAVGPVLAPVPRPEPAAIKRRPEPTAPTQTQEAPTELQGVALDADGHPVAEATVVVGASDPGRSGHSILATDARGRFIWKLPRGLKEVGLVIHKEGLAPAAFTTYAPSLGKSPDLKFILGKPDTFTATLVDGAGKPVAGATVRVDTIAQAGEIQKDGDRTSVGTSFSRIPRGVIEGSPVSGLFTTTTDAQGTFSFKSHTSGSGLKLLVTGTDGKQMRIFPSSAEVGIVRRVMHDQGYITAPPGEATRLTAITAARITGRVVSNLNGVSFAEMTANYQVSHRPGKYEPTGNSSGTVSVAPDGRFVFDGLTEGTVNVFVHGVGENQDWTYRAAQDVNLAMGATSEVTLELMRGVEVEGTVVVHGKNQPIEGADVGVYGPFRPRSGAMTRGFKTDAQGRYRYRLPAGETYFYVMGPPTGFARLASEGSSRTVTIPDGPPKFEVPPIELEPAVTLRGRVVDTAGRPITGATVVGTCEGGRCLPFAGPNAVTDAQGEFRLTPSLNNTVAIGKPARLLIRLVGGVEHEAIVIPSENGAVTVKLSVEIKAP